MALKNFNEMQRRVLRRISTMDFSETDDNALLPKVKNWINERYASIVRFRPWSELLFQQSLQIVAGQTDYVLDRKTDKVWNSFDTNNGLVINKIDVQDHVRNNAVSQDVNSNVYYAAPTEYYSIGEKTTMAVVGGTTGERVSVSSSSASDVAPLVIHIVGEVSGVEVSEDIVLTGTVAALSSHTFDSGSYLHISAGTNDGSEVAIDGVVTVIGNTSGSMFTKITQNEQAPLYQWIRVAPTPNSDATQPLWTIWASRKVRELVSDNDIPFIDCCDELVYGAFADALREDGQENSADVADQKFINMVTSLWISKQDTKKFIQMVPTGRDRYVYADFGRAIYVN